MMDFPATLSPVITFRPGPKDVLLSLTKAKSLDPNPHPLLSGVYPGFILEVEALPVADESLLNRMFKIQQCEEERRGGMRTGFGVP